MSFNGLPDKKSELVLEGTSFWPDLPVAEFQELYRIPAEYREALVLDHLALARAWAVRQLLGWQGKQEVAGYRNIADIPHAGLPGEAQRIFKRAVYCHAKALLLPQFATMDRREGAKNEAKEAPESAHDFFAKANDAIADLLSDFTDTGRINIGFI